MIYRRIEHAYLVNRRHRTNCGVESCVGFCEDLILDVDVCSLYHINGNVISKAAHRFVLTNQHTPNWHENPKGPRKTGIPLADVTRECSSNIRVMGVDPRTNIFSLSYIFSYFARQNKWPNGTFGSGKWEETMIVKSAESLAKRNRSSVSGLIMTIERVSSTPKNRR